MVHLTLNATLLLLLIAGLLLSVAYAANLPAGYPKQEEFQDTGTFDEVVKERKSIVINDQEYMMSPNLIVITANKKNSRLRDVHQGRKVGIFFIEGTLDSLPVVTEIWEFPRGL
jgi:hypothetical protein